METRNKAGWFPHDAVAVVCTQHAVMPEATTPQRSSLSPGKPADKRPHGLWLPQNKDQKPFLSLCYTPHMQHALPADNEKNTHTQSAQV